MLRKWLVLWGTLFLMACGGEEVPLQNEWRIFEPELGLLEQQLIGAIGDGDILFWELELPIGSSYGIQISFDFSYLEEPSAFGTDTRIIERDTRYILLFDNSRSDEYVFSFIELTDENNHGFNRVSWVRGNTPPITATQIHRVSSWRFDEQLEIFREDFEDDSYMRISVVVTPN